MRSHQIRVIDYEVRWTSTEKLPVLSRRRIYEDFSKVQEEAEITVIRPGILRLPLLEFISILVSHTREIRSQIKHFSPDVILGFGILNALLGLLFARRKGIPFLYYLIDELHALVPNRILQPLAKLIESYVLRHAFGVFVINERLREFAIRLGANPRQTYVIRAGVDPERFSTADGTEIRQRLGVGTKDVLLFFMGGMFSFSGIREVVNDLVTARSKYPEIKFLIVGRARSADFQEELNRVIRSNELEDRVFLLGWQPYEQIPFLLAAADICLLPAYDNEVMHNIVPIKIYEYMISGKPVVSTQLPGIVTEFGYGNGVSYVDGPSEVIAKVVDMIKNRTDLEQQGRRARAFVKRYTWDSVVDEFEENLEGVILERKRTITLE